MSNSGTQRTLALIKPDAVNRAAEIEKVIADEGFTIIERKQVTLSRADAETFYAEHKGKPFFETLIEYMTSGDVIAFILSGEDAVARWRQVLGPTKVSVARQEAPASLRARFGDPGNDSKNGTHGSDSLTSAQREIKFFFPDWEKTPKKEMTLGDYLRMRRERDRPAITQAEREACRAKLEAEERTKCEAYQAIREAEERAKREAEKEAKREARLAMRAAERAKRDAKRAEIEAEERTKLEAEERAKLEAERAECESSDH